MRPGPPPSPSSSCTLPTAMDAPEPTHSPPQPRRQPPSKPPRPPCPVRPPNAARTPALATFWSPCPRPPEAIKTPVDPSQRTHTPPQPIPTLLSSSLPRKHPISARERRCILENFGHHWSCRWFEVEERSRRCRSASPPPSSASPLSRPRRRTLVTATPVSPWSVPG
jgi:hypothetical protein